MSELTHWGQAALSTVEKLVRSPFGGVSPKPVEPGPGTVVLDKPMPDDGASLWQALSQRRSTREFSARAIDSDTLSGLLWSADGVNRKEGGRTAPSARAMYAIDVYVARADGLYLYEPSAHALQLVHPLDLRRLTGLQSFVDAAPIELVYVEDRARLQHVDEAIGEHYGYAEAGAISQNVSLFCAAHGMACVVRALIDRPPLARAMQLREAQRILLAQTVGYPAEPGATA